MTPDQISKLPPELRPAAELWNEGYRNDPLSALNAALTYCLQMQEELRVFTDARSNKSDWCPCCKQGWGVVIQLVEACKELRTAEATIATLTRERNAAVVVLRAKCSDSEWEGLQETFGAALSHTPEGGTNG